MKGSVKVALEAKPRFSHYIFIERSKRKCDELRSLITNYPEQISNIDINEADANTFLLDWCKTTDWKSTRAVVFLDPFGMQVEWSVLEALADTRGVDLWLLVPLGIGVNRLLTKGLPNEKWSERLTKFFGTEDWQTEFYKPKSQLAMFAEGTEVEKVADHDRLAEFFVERLRKIFRGGVAKNPLVQRNSQNSPMFLLCFAAANPNGARIALKIAEHLLKE